MILNDKVVLVTGGTGSFGRKFAEIVLKRYTLRKLIIFSRDELKQSEMCQVFGGKNVRYFIGDVRDLDRLRRAMRGVDIVIHAAAMKQVPACEYNPLEAVKTNVLGAANIIEAAIDARVQKVLAISTDKAVNPVNLYGATKLCAEKILVQGNAYATESGTRFSCARYGNVVGSRGSVILKPVHPWWTSGSWAEAPPVGDGFRFAGDSNSRWLTLGDLRQAIHE